MQRSSKTTHPLESTLPITSSWFRQSKFASFQRQLNTYGFTCIKSGTFFLLKTVFGCAHCHSHPSVFLCELGLSFQVSTRGDTTMNSSSEANRSLRGVFLAWRRKAWVRRNPRPRGTSLTFMRSPLFRNPSRSIFLRQHCRP
jgi:hypothetical protein